MAYHQYENYTADDLKIDYNQLLEEYYEGSSMASRISNSRVRAGYTTPVKDRTSAEDKEYMQRFIQLKFTIKFLQQTKQFLRYCYYGKCPIKKSIFCPKWKVWSKHIFCSTIVILFKNRNFVQN